MSTQVVHFERNFIRTAVCELRFPTLFEIDKDKPPLSLARSLRKEYPMYELQDELNVLAGRPTKSRAHLFTSRKSLWKVSLRSSAISLETSRYDSFPEFRKRLAFIVEAAKETIDSDFFTRVGLRYINAIPFNDEDIGTWINPSLVGVLSDGAYGRIQECFQRLTGLTPFGGYLFQHGLEQGESGKTGYILDYDFYCEEIAVSNVLDMVDELHSAEYSMFSRALGDRAKEYLGPSTLQKREKSNV
ncbi:MAG TPA: TIGR04255 family protein [Nitrosospira sp.]|nr:TIGR04255 family protein [Nitrosospira sp.]